MRFLRLGKEPGRGFGLIEVLIALLIMMLLIAGLTGALVSSIDGVRISTNLADASSLAREEMESLRNTDFDLITLGETQIDSGRLTMVRTITSPDPDYLVVQLLFFVTAEMDPNDPLLEVYSSIAKEGI